MRDLVRRVMSTLGLVVVMWAAVLLAADVRITPVVAEDRVRLFRPAEDAIDDVVRRLVPVPLEPEDHVRFP